jgi:hypothetical protein
MAAPNGDFFIQEKLGSTAPHHESFQQLWETKWKPLVRTRILGTPIVVSRRSSDLAQCTMGVYPFMFGSVKDFEPVVERLIKVGSNITYKRSDP